MWSVKAHNELVASIDVDYDSTPAAFNILMVSDVHFDNPKCRRDMFFRHLDEAAEAGAAVVIVGDFFDVMAGQHDKRRAKNLLRPEYVTSNYIQDVVLDAAEKLKPYAANIALICEGNHETAIKQHQEVDVIKWLAYELRRAGSPCLHRGYHGFIEVAFRASKHRGHVRRHHVYFHHGKYGGVVSKGVQGVARHGLIAPDADTIATGHTHDQWMVEQPRFRLKRSREVRIEPQIHIKMGTYKEEFLSASGWAVEKIAMPKSLGGWWIDFSMGGAQKELVPAYRRAQ